MNKSNLEERLEERKAFPFRQANPHQIVDRVNGMIDDVNELAEKVRARTELLYEAIGNATGGLVEFKTEDPEKQEKENDPVRPDVGGTMVDLIENRTLELRRVLSKYDRYQAYLMDLIVHFHAASKELSNNK